MSLVMRTSSGASLSNVASGSKMLYVQSGRRFRDFASMMTFRKAMTDGPHSLSH